MWCNALRDIAPHRSAASRRRDGTALRDCTHHGLDVISPVGETAQSRRTLAQIKMPEGFGSCGQIVKHLIGGINFKMC
jgi:hypothetical protein